MEKTFASEIAKAYAAVDLVKKSTAMRTAATTNKPRASSKSFVDLIKELAPTLITCRAADVLLEVASSTMPSPNSLTALTKNMSEHERAMALVRVDYVMKMHTSAIERSNSFGHLTAQIQQLFDDFLSKAASHRL